jgi:hypothetical protein
MHVFFSNQTRVETNQPRAWEHHIIPIRVSPRNQDMQINIVAFVVVVVIVVCLNRLL